MLFLPLLCAVQQIAPQTTPNAPLPKAELPPPPQPDAQIAAVLAPVNAMFAGLTARDAAAIRAQLLPDGGATVAIEKPDGTTVVRHLGWDQFLSGIKPGPERLEEKFTGTPAVEVDGDIAMVWGAYTFTIDGKLSHCGTDHFDLVRQDGTWKVVNVTWTQRTTGCAAQ